jgi:hypothetical protein
MENRLEHVFFEGYVLSRKQPRYEFRIAEKAYLNLFFLNSEETVRQEILRKDILSENLNLEFARNVIANEHYPDHGELWYYPNGKAIFYDDPDGIKDNSVALLWGRRYLIDMIGFFGYSKAIPELREVLLHDSRRMKVAVLDNLHFLDEELSDKIVLEFLDESEKKEDIVLALMYIRLSSTKPIFLDVLRNKFEDNYLDHDITDPVGRYRGTINQKVIWICGLIPDIRAANLIEDALGHPFGSVERDATYNITMWINTVISSGSKDPELIKKALHFSKMFSSDNLSNDTWKAFKKIAS